MLPGDPNSRKGDEMVSSSPCCFLYHVLKTCGRVWKNVGLTIVSLMSVIVIFDVDIWRLLAFLKGEFCGCFFFFFSTTGK